MPQESDAYTRALRERIWELEETVRQLRASALPVEQWPIAMHLSDLEGRVLMQLYKSFPRMLTKSFLTATFFPDSVGNSLPNLKSKINAKLRPWGAEVKNSWGLGLYLEHTSWALLSDLLAAQAPSGEALLPPVQSKKGTSA